MSMQILATKLYIPPLQAKVVLRPRLIERMNEGLDRKLALISAPAGFGKTTLVSEWVTCCKQLEPKVRVAWLSLDEGDNDSTRFLAYLVAALQTVAVNIGTGVIKVLHSPQPPPAESILTILLNEITVATDPIILVLDDYHMIKAKPVNLALTFLIEHLPPQIHLVIATREDPQLPLARYRARGQLTELRAADLRFIPTEAADFLNRAMGLNLATENIAALESRTEGWIAGLQLAAISMRGHQDTAGFIRSFTGSHSFVMDYLVEEVLQQQSASLQTFLLRTSILNRLCGPLCDAIMLDSSASGQTTLEYLEQANLFIVPLDNERCWYRYHHLFADLLRQRLHQIIASSTEDAESRVSELHIRASRWYEDNGLEMEAFHHAAAAHDIERAERLSEGKSMPLHFRGAAMAILDWLKSLSSTDLDARPSLWVKYGSLLLVCGQTIGVEEKLQAAEAALQGTGADDKTRNLVGRIAAARATLALTRYQVEPMLVQSRRALEYLRPDNLFARATANWTLGFAHYLRKETLEAHRAYTEAISLSKRSGATFATILAMIGLGMVQESENQLFPAAETYRHVLELSGDPPQLIVHEAHLGLARVLYEWNDLDAAERHGQRSLELARQYESHIDRFVICEVFLARLKLAQGDDTGAAAILARVGQSARQQNFIYRIPEVAAAQVLTFLHRGDLPAAAHLAETYELPLSRARVFLARGDTSSALAVIEAVRRNLETRGWQNERIKAMILHAVTLHAHGDKEKAVEVLCEALTLAQPGGFIRIFVDEGLPMAKLLSSAASNGLFPDYTGKLLASFAADKSRGKMASPAQPFCDPLSLRELEILELIAQGLSNREVGKRLYLELSTVKGYNQRIFAKLDVKRRTEAVARARRLGLL